METMARMILIRQLALEVEQVAAFKLLHTLFQVMAISNSRAVMAQLVAAAVALVDAS